MKIIIDIDTNDYENTAEDSFARELIAWEWSVWTLNLATFQDWQVAGQTPLWTVDGDAWCGTRYSCQVNYQEALLLRCLIDKIKKTCGDRLMGISIDDLPVTYINDDLVEMRPEWMESMKKA